MWRPVARAGSGGGLAGDEGGSLTLSDKCQATTQNQDSLIRVEKFPDRPIQFPVTSKKFPVPMRREFPCNSLDLLPYLVSLCGSQGLNGQNSLFFPS